MGLWGGTKVPYCLDCVSMFWCPPILQNRALVAFKLLPFPSCNAVAAYVLSMGLWPGRKQSDLHCLAKRP